MQAVQLHVLYVKGMRYAWRDAGPACSHLRLAVDASNTTRLGEGVLTVPHGRQQSKVPTCYILPLHMPATYYCCTCLLRRTPVQVCYVLLLYVRAASYCCTCHSPLPSARQCCKQVLHCHSSAHSARHRDAPLPRKRDLQLTTAVMALPTTSSMSLCCYQTVSQPPTQPTYNVRP
jgi:hypothetical protein